MKIIFLDIDGVLNVRRRQRDKYGSLFHKKFVDNLWTIIEKTDAKIVITSTWRYSGNTFIRNMWIDRELPGEILGITPIIHDSPRGKEIEELIRRFTASGANIERYVIIDDDSDMLPEQLPYFVRTSGNIDHSDSIELGLGLTKQCAEQSIKILNS